MKVRLKNGTIGILTGDAHVLFDNDNYTHTVPVDDIVCEISNEKKYIQLLYNEIDKINYEIKCTENIARGGKSYRQTLMFAKTILENILKDGEDDVN